MILIDTFEYMTNVNSFQGSDLGKRGGTNPNKDLGPAGKKMYRQEGLGTKKMGITVLQSRLSPAGRDGRPRAFKAMAGTAMFSIVL